MFSLKKANLPVSKTPDHLLIAHYQESGEERYINELFRRYYHLIFGTCLKFLKDQEESKDMTMIIFEKLFQKLKSQHITAFNQWLYSLCSNECRNRLRSRQPEKEEARAWQTQYEEESRGTEDTVITDLFEPEDSSELSETVLVQRAISKLPEEQRKCVRLFFLKNMSYKEVAAKTNFDLKEVKSHLQNGKRRLRQLLESRLGNPSINKPEQAS